MKITLLGDSIRLIGYGTVLQQLLGDEFTVFQPDDNCRFSKYTLRCLFDWQDDMKDSSIVHWNNGLWDICNLFGDGCFTPEDEYIDNMLRIADILQNRYKNVIFATTTPVNPAHIHNKNCDIERYNNIIVPLLKEKGIIINDLYSIVAKDIEKYICDDLIHLSDEGIKVCSEAVKNTILDVAKKL